MKKEKYLQIFRYLLEFSKIRTESVSDIEVSSKYLEIIWLESLLNVHGVECILNSNFDNDIEYWVRIFKPKLEPVKPLPPFLQESFKDWIDIESYNNLSDKPKLLASIEKDGTLLYLNENNWVLEKFEKYISDKWPVDFKEYSEKLKKYDEEIFCYNQQNEIYKSFFSLYNKSEQFKDEYELVLALGLFSYKNNNNGKNIKIFRHLLTVKAEITFNFSDNQTYVTVLPNLSDKIQIETDPIIESTEFFDPNYVISAEKELKDFIKSQEIHDDLLHEKIKDALRLFADRVDEEGQFIDDLHKPKHVEEKPRVTYSPALILRKRDAKNLTVIYQEIINEIEKCNENINIDSLNSLLDEDVENDIESNNRIDGKLFNNDDIIYFPKIYNEAQVEIIEKANKYSKVLVQGPPGTGKSHTIANIICHLLSKGNKILVTAATKRALEVLKGQLPEGFQNLAVSLLSNDSGSLQDLERSVNVINDKLDSISISKLEKLIKEDELKYTNIKENLAQSKNELLLIKEKDNRVIKINENYIGKLIELSERIEKDRVLFEWYEDAFSDTDEIEFADAIIKFRDLAKTYSQKNNDEFKYEFPDLEQYINVEIFEKAINIINRIESFEEINEIPSIIYFTNVNSFDLNSLYQKVTDYENELLRLENINNSIKEEILKDAFNILEIWDKRVEKGRAILERLNEDRLETFDRTIELEYPRSKSIKQLIYDSEKLISYLNDGGTLNGVIFNLKKHFLPLEIKERLYFLTEIKVNGSLCNNISALMQLNEGLRFKQDFFDLELMFVESNLEAFSEKYHFYSKFIINVENIISILKRLNELKNEIELNTDLRILSLDKNIVRLLIKKVQHIKFKQDKSKIIEVFEKFKSQVEIKDRHPLYEKIINAIENRSLIDFKDAYLKLVNLKNQKNEYQKFLASKEELQFYFPKIINKILTSEFENISISDIKNAIYFKNAENKINLLLKKNNENELFEIIKKLEKNESKIIRDLAYNKAWLHVMKSLHSNQSLRTNLQAWVLAQKKIGKGTRKRAIKFKKEAQIQMDSCKESIPCWIMPQYKLTETIKPQRQMYDYVIVDEASQLGVDSLFLLYISKNIIIVGDDKQTSPEYIGVEANALTPKINKYLSNIPRSTYYGTEFSFFDHAKLFCNGGTTILREHFRCMPEIIDFCNKHFYLPEGKGLYPLKQYSEDRLPPIMSTYVINGYTEGSSPNIINKQEAEEISNKIAEIIKNEKYYSVIDGKKIPKSIGVISLQGERQAEIIDNLILKKIGENEKLKRKIVCGSSASFQGDERDIIFLSLVTANNHSRHPLTNENDKRRFNVAVSRAKEQIWLFHSVLQADLSNQNDLRYKLLDHFLNYQPLVYPKSKSISRALGNQPEPFDSWFEVDVYNDLVAKGLSVIPQYEVAGGRYRIDLVLLLNNGSKIAIECDGDKFHGPEHYLNDLLRQKVLERCGWQFFRIRGSEYYSNRNTSLESLWKMIEAVNKNNQEIDVLSTEKTECANNKGEVISNNQIETSEVSIVSKKTENRKRVIRTSPNYNRRKEILIFSSNGNVYKIFNKNFMNVSQILQNIEMELGDDPIYITGTDNYEGFIVFAYLNGKIAKIPMESYVTTFARKKLKNAYNISSNLIFIESFEKDDDLVAISTKDKILVFNTQQIVVTKSPNSSGVQLMNLIENSKLKEIKKLSSVKFKDPDYYRKGSLNVVGYLKRKDDIV